MTARGVEEVTMGDSGSRKAPFALSDRKSLSKSPRKKRRNDEDLRSASKKRSRHRKKGLASRRFHAYNAIPPQRTAPDAKESGRVRESGWFFEKRAEHHKKSECPKQARAHPALAAGCDKRIKLESLILAQNERWRRA